jgi:hypothetical protein
MVLYIQSRLRIRQKYLSVHGEHAGKTYVCRGHNSPSGSKFFAFSPTGLIIKVVYSYFFSPSRLNIERYFLSDLRSITIPMY